MLRIIPLGMPVARDRTPVVLRPWWAAARRSVAAARAAASLVGLWSERRRSRRALRDLSDTFLKDVGLSRSDVNRECAMPFWRP